ncbi:hypothetical protein [Embleya sp. NPDC020630]|uniref:hypothetical protein n=1 Tax=Embleya sp. NPDC020630 TaxID=3363979 RepID=UPI003794E327
MFVNHVASSPYDPAGDRVVDDRAADEAFWTEVAGLIADRGGVLLEECHLGNAYRWYRLTDEADIRSTRTRLTPRARLAVWPDLSEDAEEVRAGIARRERLAWLVRQHPNGRFHPECVAEPQMARADVPNPYVSAAPGHRAALVPVREVDRRPLSTGVLPDADGVLRARWRSNETAAEERHTFLATLRIGDIVTGVVATGLHDVGVFVDPDCAPDGVLGFLRTPEMSSSRSPDGSSR